MVDDLDEALSLTVLEDGLRLGRAARAVELPYREGSHVVLLSRRRRPVGRLTSTLALVGGPVLALSG